MSRSGGPPVRARILPAPNPRPIARSGPIESVQRAEIEIDQGLLARIWSIDTLELIARAYWAFLRRFTLGVIRVVYGPDDRTITAFGRIPLLRFGRPTYEIGETHGEVRWPILSGPLVAREGRGKGHLSVDVSRVEPGDPTKLIARVTVANFYPGLRGRGRFARFGAWFYGQTQVRIHVIACNAYLRSLARMRIPLLDRDQMPSDRDRVESSKT
jgi:hypothetical protein